MAIPRYTLFTVLACLSLTVVTGQYYYPNEYGKYYSIPSKEPAISHSLQDVEAIARSTPFEYLVADILDTADGDLSNVLDFDLPQNVSENCRRDFNQFMLNITAPYALQMLDAAGKFPSGLLQGNTKWWGRYDQCLAVKADASHDFNAAYCLTTLIATKPEALIPSVQLGLCVPDSCSSTDIDLLITLGILELPFKIDYVPSSFCEKELEKTTGFVIAVIIFSILGVLVVAGTALDVGKLLLKTLRDESEGCHDNHVQDGDRDEMRSDTKKQKASDKIMLISLDSNKVTFIEWVENLLMCFSALTNGRKLLTVQSGGPHSNLAALNGIRVISMFWVILGHTHGLIARYVDNPLVTLDIVKRFSFQVIDNSSFSVDSFFVLSGLLVCYFSLNELKSKDGRMNWGLFYFHRFWRLTPVYMLIILLWTSMAPYIGSGPLHYTLYTDFPGFKSPVTVCQDYWWTNLLYINNLYPVHMLEECLNWTWYLANDMQFYVISPFIFYLLYRSSPIGFGLIGALMATCFTSTAVVSWKYDLSPGRTQPSFNNNTMTQAEDFIYIKPWARINSYLVGMIAGYVLHLMRGRTVKIPKIAYVLGWCCAIASGLGIIYGLYGTYHGHYQTQAQAVFYYTVSRFIWSSAVAWVAFACATGYGGPVNALLGWKVWGPLARLTYCAYLLHPAFVVLYYTSAIVPIHYTDYSMIYIFFGHLMLSYSAAFIMSVCAEAPWMALEKLLLPKGSSAAAHTQTKQIQSDHNGHENQEKQSKYVSTNNLK